MMKWYDVRFWKWVSYISAIGIVLLLLYGCRTPRTITKQTYIKDCSSDKRFDSLFTARMAYSFDQWLHYQKRESERSTKDSSYIKDSTATRLDAQGNKIGEDRFHYESHVRTEKEVQKLLDSISHYRSLKDSVAIYRHRLDSLSNIKISSDSATKVIEKPLTAAQKIYIQIGQAFCFCLVIIVIYLLYSIKRKGS
nr:MAG TPA_asm: holin [Caudoviricetes sp.]